jgi:hypothetical protein
MTRGVGSLLLAVVAVAGLASLVACGGNSSGAVTPPPPPPNTSGPVEIFPGTVSVPLNGNVNFTAFLPGTPAAHFSWAVGGTANGSIDANTGIYTAPASVPSPATATITATTANGSGTATINITAAQGVVVSPAGIAVPAGATQTFLAAVSGVAVTPTWQVNGTPGGDGVHGTITSGGVYTAPLTPPPGGSTTVTAVSGANSGTSSVTVVFSTSSLNGPYAFSYSGTDSGGPLAVAGRFTASPSSNPMLVGLEDYNSLKIRTPDEAQAFTGTFVVNPDGSGSATVTDAAIGGNDTWHFALTPGSQGGASPTALLVRFDAAATGSGDMDQQNPAQLSLSAFAGNYVFGLGGFDPSGKALQIAGKFKADGLGNIPVNFAVEDINDGGATNTSGGADTTLHGTFFLDAMSPGTGRGILQLINTSTQFPATLNFTFYLVDSTHLKLVENDVNAFLAGSCFAAPNTNGSFGTGVLTGRYTFTLGGASSGGQPETEGGAFAVNGAGTISGGELDRNTGGSTTLAQTLSASSYSVDPNLGRITFSLSIGSNSVAYAGYAATSGSVEIISLDPSRSEIGQALNQTSTGPVAGTFALNLRGVTSGSKTFAGENVIGGIEVNSSLDALSGSIDLNSAGSLASGVPLQNTSSITAADANGRGTASLVTTGSTFGVAYYVVNPNTLLLLGTDGSRVMLGSATAQF